MVGGGLAWVTGSQAQAGKFQDRADRLDRKDEDCSRLLSALLTGTSADGGADNKEEKDETGPPEVATVAP